MEADWPQFLGDSKWVKIDTVIVRFAPSLCSKEKWELGVKGENSASWNLCKSEQHRKVTSRGYVRLPWWLSDKESGCQCRRHGFDSYRIQEDPTCHRATKPICHNYWAHEPQLLKPAHPKACGLQQEEPPQWEAQAPQLESSPHSLQLEKSPTQQQPRPSTAKNNKYINLKKNFFKRLCHLK